MKNIERGFDVFAADCPSRQAFDHIFSRWNILILARLSEGDARFRELSRGVEGISERMLSKNLKILEEEGLINRRDYQEKLPRVEYSLTDSGRRIAEGALKVISQLYAELDHRFKPQGDSN